MKLRLTAKFSLAFALVLLPLLGLVAFDFIRVAALRQRVQELGNIKLAALRATATAIAMQHAVRVAPYRAILGSETGNETEMKAAVAEARESSASLRVAAESLATMPLGGAAREANGGVQSTLTNYTARADELIAFALAGQTAKALEATPDFQAAFKSLQAGLTRLLVSIEIEVSQSLAAAQELSVRSKHSAQLTGLIGILFGLSLATAIRWTFGGSSSERTPGAKNLAAGTMDVHVSEFRLQSHPIEPTVTKAESRSLEFIPLVAREVDLSAKERGRSAEKKLV